MHRNLLLSVLCVIGLLGMGFGGLTHNALLTIATTMLAATSYILLQWRTRYA